MQPTHFISVILLFLTGCYSDSDDVAVYTSDNGDNYSYSIHLTNGSYLFGKRPIIDKNILNESGMNFYPKIENGAVSIPQIGFAFPRNPQDRFWSVSTLSCSSSINSKSEHSVICAYPNREETFVLLDNNGVLLSFSARCNNSTETCYYQLEGHRGLNIIDAKRWVDDKMPGTPKFR